MSRNLARGRCCEHTLRLSDFRGKPIEFRRYGKWPPVMGTRWECPSCKTVYFIFGVWDRLNANHQPATFMLDMSYYESYNDEHDYSPGGEDIVGLDKPRNLCLDDAEDVQELWP